MPGPARTGESLVAVGVPHSDMMGPRAEVAGRRKTVLRAGRDRRRSLLDQKRRWQEPWARPVEGPERLSSEGQLSARADVSRGCGVKGACLWASTPPALSGAGLQPRSRGRAERSLLPYKENVLPGGRATLCTGTAGRREAGGLGAAPKGTSVTSEPAARSSGH